MSNNKAIPTPSSRKNTSTPSDKSFASEEVSQKFKKRTSSIVEWLNKTTSKLGGKYVLVVVSPDNGTDIYFNSPMASFVDNFLLEKDIVDYLSKGGEGTPDYSNRKLISSGSNSGSALMPNTSLRPKIKLDLFNHEEVIQYYCRGFLVIQQAICKLLAKSWIKEIEPKKQTAYPYKLGDISKPDWWPEHVRHKEPDHLTKDERVKLLLSLITLESIPIARLRESSIQLIREVDQDRLALLEEIYTVAELGRRLSNGRIQDHIVEVTDLSSWAKQTKVAIKPSVRVGGNGSGLVSHSKEREIELKEKTRSTRSYQSEIMEPPALFANDPAHQARYDAHQQFVAVTNGYPTASPINTIYSSSLRMSSSSSSSSSASFLSASNTTNTSLTVSTPSAVRGTSHYLNPFDTWLSTTPNPISMSGGVSNRLLVFDQTISPSSSTPNQSTHDGNGGYYLPSLAPRKQSIRNNQESHETPSRIPTSSQRLEEISTPVRPNMLQPIQGPLTTTLINTNNKRQSSDRNTNNDEDNDNIRTRSKRFKSQKEYYPDELSIKYETQADL